VQVTHSASRLALRCNNEPWPLVRGFPTVEHRAIRNIKREDRGVSLDEALALCETLGVTMSIQDGMVILSDSPTLARDAGHSANAASSREPQADASPMFFWSQ